MNSLKINGNDSKWNRITVGGFVNSVSITTSIEACKFIRSENALTNEVVALVGSLAGRKQCTRRR